MEEPPLTESCEVLGRPEGFVSWFLFTCVPLAMLIAFLIVMSIPR